MNKNTIANITEQLKQTPSQQLKIEGGKDGKVITFNGDSDTVALFVPGGPKIGALSDPAKIAANGVSTGFNFGGSMAKWIQELSDAQLVTQPNCFVLSDVQNSAEEFVCEEEPRSASEITVELLEKLIQETQEFWGKDNAAAEELVVITLDNLEELINKYASEGKKVIVFGQSYGGFLINHALANRPDVFKNAHKIVIAASRFNLSYSSDIGGAIKDNSLLEFEYNPDDKDNNYGLKPIARSMSIPAQALFHILQVDITTPSPKIDPAYKVFEAINEMSQVRMMQGMATNHTVGITESFANDENLKAKCFVVYNQHDEAVGSISKTEIAWLENTFIKKQILEIDPVTPEGKWSYPYQHAYLYNNEDVQKAVIKFIRS